MWIFLPVTAWILLFLLFYQSNYWRSSILLNDPRITTPGIEFSIEGLSNFEDTARNPIHFYLIVLGIAICLSWGNLRRQPNLIQYLITVVCSFLLFCLLIKWQAWQSRLHLTAFVLFSAFMGIVFSTNFNKRIYTYLAICIIPISLFWVFFNTSKPIFDDKNIFNMIRINQYFSIRSNLVDSNSLLSFLLKFATDD